LTGNSLRVAFIGAGNMARAHLQALRLVPTPHTVVGVYDANQDMARSFAALAGATARPYSTLAELLEREAGGVQLVHICTPAGTHFEPAEQALRAGAHVYVEKPFVDTPEQADTLLRLAESRQRLVCAGHQLLRDRAFARLMERAAALAPVAFVDSTFTFRPPTLHLGRASGRALAQQLLDILPHPLYSLLAALDRVTSGEGEPEIVSFTASPTELFAQVRQAGVTGRLLVSLTARPVTSTVSLSGAGGTLIADTDRGNLLGIGNPGTAPLEKIANPVLEGLQASWGGVTSLARRFTRGGYSGLSEILADFYLAVAANGTSPVTPHNIRATVKLQALFAADILHSAVQQDAPRSDSPASAPRSRGSAAQRVAALTGAGGFFGRAIASELARRGFRVRGVGRSPAPANSACAEWVRADLSRDSLADALNDADVVVHAAAETNGGAEAHQRNSVDATRRLIEAMQAAGVRELVHVSSISVLRPPRHPWERQDERTPVATNPEPLGPYTWGKCASEALVTRAQEEGRIAARIVRPAALIDWNELELPGLVGKRLFDRWHLGLGRPGLPFAAVDVEQAAAVVAWCASDFASAPPVVNLFDDAIPTRARLLRMYRDCGWNGRMVWVPISALACAISLARFVFGIVQGQKPAPLSVWGILQPRRFDATISRSVLREAAQAAPRTTRFTDTPFDRGTPVAGSALSNG